ncbi:MAG: hypothetical protein ABFS34_12850 [Gemmatimonadota bacterium]
MTQAQVVRETDRAIRLAYSHRTGAVLIAIGIAIAIGAAVFGNGGRIPGVVVGLLFAGAGALAFTYRLQFDMDLELRRWRMIRGFLWRLRERQGTFDDLAGVVIELHWVTTGGKHNRRKVPSWRVGLGLGDGKVAANFYGSRVEVDAFRKWEAWAKKLRVPAVDRTGGGERVLDWRDLDRSLEDSSLTADPGREGEAAVDGLLADPPEGSLIGVTTVAGGAVELWIPSAASRGRRVGALLLALPLLGFGGAALWAAAGGPGAVESNATAAWIAGLVFAFAGMGVAAAGFGRTGTVIREEGDTIVFGTRALGRVWGEKHVAKRAVEALDLATSSAARRGRGGTGLLGRTWAAGRSGAGRELRVRSDDAIVRVGRGLNRDELEWLRGLLRALISES